MIVEAVKVTSPVEASFCQEVSADPEIKVEDSAGTELTVAESSECSKDSGSHLSPERDGCTVEAGTTDSRETSCTSATDVVAMESSRWKRRRLVKTGYNWLSFCGVETRFCQTV